MHRGRLIFGKPQVNMFSNKFRGKKGRFITCVGDTKLGRKDDTINDNISTPKGLQELERLPEQLK